MLLHSMTYEIKTDYDTSHKFLKYQVFLESP